MVEDLERLIKSRTAHRAVTTRYNNEANVILKKDTSAITPEDIIRLEQLSKNLGKQQAQSNEMNQRIQDSIVDDERLNTDIMESEDLDDQYGQFVDAINRFIALITSHQSAPTSTARASTSGSASVKLPKLDLPFFKGDYLKWKSFYDLFVGAVHTQPDLSPSQKLQYLKSRLQDDAAQLIESIEITDANYDIALEALRNRYVNERLILRAPVQEIISQRPVVKENYVELRKLTELFHEHRLALQNHGQPVQQQDLFFLYLLVENYL